MGRTIKEILDLSLEDQIALIEKGDISDAIVQTYALDTAVTDKQIEIAGNFLGMVFGTDTNVNVDIKFQKSDSTAINFTQGLYMNRPFGRVFLTWAAQAGKTVKIIYSSFSNGTFGIQDNRSATSQATILTTIKNQLVGASSGTFGADVSVSTVAKVVTGANTITAFRLYADKANTDSIYLGFDNTVDGTHKIFELQPGDFWGEDNLKADIWAIAASGTQKLSVTQW